MSTSAHVLFDLVDDKLESAAKAIRNQVFSEYRDIPWTTDQRRALQPLVQKELDLLFYSILGLFDNVGCVLPEETVGWSIVDRKDSRNIRIDNADYSDMWLNYLHEKGRLAQLTENTDQK